MDPFTMEDLLNPAEMEKKVKRAVTAGQKAVSAFMKAGTDAFRAAAGAASSAIRQPGVCPECETAREHSDVKNYVCPPADVCVPRCLARLELRARPGELRVVPFGVRNTSNERKTYKVGVRRFTNANGEEMDILMALSENSITIPPGKSVPVDLLVRIPRTAPVGMTCETDIVVCESKHNQNICFTLVIEGRCTVPIASPFDEKYLNMKFHRWHHHFYCTPRTKESHLPEMQTMAPGPEKGEAGTSTCDCGR